MKVTIINKSDSTGGAAVVSRRLMEALRRQGVDARMLVVEKLSESPYIELAAPSWKIKLEFLKERLKIYIANGRNRNTLFQIDTGETGLSLWRHPLVKQADAVLLGWVNQGMLSLAGVRKILELGKPVVWTMHDMWNLTGVCHHAHACTHYQYQCGDCFLLGKQSDPNDLSHRIWTRKSNLYNSPSGSRLHFVAVSSWLGRKGSESSLLGDKPVSVIPNPYDLTGSFPDMRRKAKNDKIKILFGAARIDDPIKGLPVLKKMTEVLRREYPETAEKTELSLFGNMKNPESLSGFEVPVRYLGILKGGEVKKAYDNADIVVSASSYETFPGTLVEAQAYGAIPVSFDRGGQGDIITHLKTGYLAEYSENPVQAAKNLAEGVDWAVSVLDSGQGYRKILSDMRESVAKRFSYESVADSYIKLIRSLL